MSSPGDRLDPDAGTPDLRNMLYSRGDWCGECDPSKDEGCCPLPDDVRAALTAATP